MAELDIKKYVSAEQGKISREVYVNEDLFQRELETIFTRAWLFVGHESMVPNPDDYIVSRMGNDSVILTRDHQGDIQVLLNTCLHRGMKLCRYDFGNNRTFTCPYHGWSYSTNGRLVEQAGELVGVPGFKTHYYSDLDKKAWGLKRVAQLRNYKGTIWATWDDEAPPFEDFLGDMRLYLDFALDHRDGRPGGSAVIGGIQKWRIPCNWKTAVENFNADLYHDISHRSVDIVGIGPSGKGRRDPTPNRVSISFEAHGHGVVGRAPYYEENPYTPQFSQYPEVEAYYSRIYGEREERLKGSKRVLHSVGVIFPNIAIHGRQPRTLAVFHPVSATVTEMWRIFLVDADSPQEVKDAARSYALRYSGPGGMTESDDMENWVYATEASGGTIARTLDYNYQMGLGREYPVEGLNGAVTSGEFTEANNRNFYKRWVRFLEGEPWSALMNRKASA